MAHHGGEPDPPPASRVGDDREFLDGVLTALPGLVFAIDEAGHFVQLGSRPIARILGRTPCDYCDDAPWLDVHTDDRAAVSAAVREAFATGFASVSARILTSEGPRWYRISGRLARIGDARYLVCSGADLTDLRAAETALQAANQRLAMLVGLSGAIAAAVSPALIARDLADRVRAAFDADACVLRELRDGDLTLLAASGLPDGILPAILPVYGLAEKLLVTREPLVIGAIEEDAVTRPYATPGSPGIKFRSYAGAPLYIGDEAIGVLGVYALERPDAFSKDDAALLKVAADQVAIRLANERLYRTIANQREDLRRAADDLEHRVAERTTELTAAVGELEAFTYTVSHDLRAPLRAISGYAGIICEDHGDEISDDVRHYLDRIQQGAERLGVLIDDLLGFARTGRHALARTVVSPGQIVRSVLDEAAVETAGRSVDVRVADLPDCSADPILLRQVYANLIGNALKYTRQRDRATITVGAETRGDETVYFVRDNGVGFDMRYVDQIFGVFTRLHHADEFEGSGVGLANVQRIVERHGGRVWAESEIGRGSTFYFTIGA